MTYVSQLILFIFVTMRKGHRDTLVPCAFFYSYDTKFILLGRTFMTLNVDNVLLSLHLLRQRTFLLVLFFRIMGGPASWQKAVTLGWNSFTAGLIQISSWVFPCFGKAFLSRDDRNACGGLSRRMQSCAQTGWHFFFFSFFSKSFQVLPRNCHYRTSLFCLLLHRWLISFIITIGVIVLKVKWSFHNVYHEKQQ